MSYGVASPTLADGGSFSVPPRIKNLIGRTFGQLTVVGYAGRTNQNGAAWICRCTCGVEKIIRGWCLTRSQAPTISCGCYRRRHTSKRCRADLAGQQFGRLKVEKSSGIDRWQNQIWKCRCACGATVVVAGYRLITGRTRSCGCYCREQIHKANFNPNLTTEDRVRARLDRAGSDSYALLARKILLRDKFTCFACGDIGGRLSVHHIFPWARHKKLRYLEANLITLCRECHYQFHTLYGNDCDLEDLEEFLKP